MAGDTEGFGAWGTGYSATGAAEHSVDWNSAKMAATILPIANFIKFIQFFIHISAIIHWILLDLYLMYTVDLFSEVLLSFIVDF